MAVLTKTGEQLVRKLKGIWNDYDFVVGVMSYLKTDEERQILIDGIDAGLLTTDEAIVLFALDIHQEREGKA